jgi:hypothetical protein
VVDRSQEAGILLACLGLALLVLVALVANVARLGSAIALEVERAQVDYMQGMGGDALARRNARLLGQCLQREMLKSVRSAFVHPDTWAVTARIKALPTCTPRLPAVSPPVSPVITAPRFRAIVTSGPASTPAFAPRRAASTHAK